VDNDGDLDLTVGNFGANTVVILKNDGSGTFTPSSTIAGQVDAIGQIASGPLAGIVSLWSVRAAIAFASFLLTPTSAGGAGYSASGGNSDARRARMRWPALWPSGTDFSAAWTWFSAQEKPKAIDSPATPVAIHSTPEPAKPSQVIEAWPTS